MGSRMAGVSISTVEDAIDGRKLAALQYRVLLLCALLLVFDGFDIGAIGFAVPAIAADWNVSPSSLTPAIVASAVGMLVGSLLSGPLGDRFGRKPALLAAVAWFGALTLACGFATSTAMLAGLRFLTGLGLGGGLPLAIALTADYAPRRRRAVLAGLMTAGVPVGLVAGGIASSQLIATFGWPAIFTVGGIVPLLLVPLGFVLLPESWQLLWERGRFDAAATILRQLGFDAATVAAPATGERIKVAPGNPVTALFGDGHGFRTLMLWLMFFCNFLATWLAIFWLPTIFVSAGASASTAALYSTLFPLGGLLGIALIAATSRDQGIEPLLAAGLALGAIALGCLWATSDNLAVAGPLAFLAGLGLQGAQFGMNGLSGAVYPSRIRVTGSGWAFGIGRIGNIIGPGLGGAVLGLGYAASAMLLVAVGPALVAMLAMLLLRRDRDGREVAGPHLIRTGQRAKGRTDQRDRML